MNKKIFLVTLLCISIGIIAVYLFTTEQQNIQKENQTQENHSSELSGIKNTFSDTQNSSINLTQTPHQQQNLSLSNITKNETYDRVYKYILKENNHGKLLETDVTIYTKEEIINNTKYVVAESKLDDIPHGVFYSENPLYETIEYVNLQTGDIKLVKILYKITTDGKLKSIPEDKKEYEFPSDVLYSNTFDEKTNEDYFLTVYYFIYSEIEALHPLYLIGFVKFEPENITITEKRNRINVTPIELRNAQNCPMQYEDNNKTYCYAVMEMFNVSYTKNSTKGIIANKSYIDKVTTGMIIDHKLTPNELEENVKIGRKKLFIESSKNIIFLGTEIFKGKEAYKIEMKSKEKALDGLGMVDTVIWIDKKDKTILYMNSSRELVGFAEDVIIYELKNVSIVKNEG